jgi:hypothetical protein
VTARRLACRCVERWAAGVVALGVAGLLGFVASLLAFVQRHLDGRGFLVATALSLLVYAASLLVGHLGDPAELERRRAAS